jgi:hypothetical protein
MAATAKTLEKFDMPVSPSEQRLRTLFDSKVNYHNMSADSKMPLFVAGPGLPGDFEDLAEELIIKVLKARSAKPQVFYLTEKPQVRGRIVTKKKKEVTEIVLFVNGRWV